MSDYVAYTDGSFRSNTSRGGYAAYVSTTGDLLYGDALNTTNNRMELIAALTIIENIPDNKSVTIYSDSAYVVNAISLKWVNAWASQGWVSKNNTPVKNADLWQSVYPHLSRVSVNMKWIKGHSGNEYNELVNEVAQYMSSER